MGIIFAETYKFTNKAKVFRYIFCTQTNCREMKDSSNTANAYYICHSSDYYSRS